MPDEKDAVRTPEPDSMVDFEVRGSPRELMEEAARSFGEGIAKARGAAALEICAGLMSLADPLHDLLDEYESEQCLACAVLGLIFQSVSASTGGAVSARFIKLNSNTMKH